MQAYDRSVDRWFEMLRSGQIRLPRFQRFEAWSHHDVASLLDTILRGLPAGAVLVLEIKGEEPFVSRSISGGPEDGERVVEHLLDGQQRLTALWRSLHDDYTSRTFFVSFEPDEETKNETHIVSRSRWKKNGRWYPLYFDDPVELWKRKMMPMRLFRPDAESESELEEWIEAATTGEEGPDFRLAMDIQKQANKIRQQIARFNIPYLSLPETTPPETALDVFIRMNTSATPLSTYDIVVAQVEAGVGASLHDLSDNLREVAPRIEEYGTPEDIMLAAAALLQGKSTNRTGFLEKDFAARLIEDWETVVRGVQRTVSFLEEERIFDRRRLPTDVVLPPLVALWGEAPDRLDAEGEARMILRRFLWRACFTERYERASNSRTLADYRELRQLVQGRDAPTPEVFDAEAFPLPDAAVFLDASWPKRKDRLARALLALSLRQGGLDLADGTPARSDNVGQREYHHLFPVAYLELVDVGESEIHRALNCALITSHTNRSISAKAPFDYIAERRNGTSLGSAEVERRLGSHLIPVEPLLNEDYDGFLVARAEMMHGPMLKLCAGESIT